MNYEVKFSRSVKLCISISYPVVTLNLKKKRYFWKFFWKWEEVEAHQYYIHLSNKHGRGYYASALVGDKRWNKEYIPLSSFNLIERIGKIKKEAIL